MPTSIRHAARALLCAAFAALAALVAWPSSAHAAEPIPLEDFFRQPAFSEAQLSPSGRLLGVRLVGANGRVVLGVVDLDRPDHSDVVAGFEDADVRRFQWVNDGRLVFDLVDFASAGGEQFAAGLYAVDADGKRLRRLVQRDGWLKLVERTIPSRELSWNHVLHGTLRDGSADVLVERYNFDNANELQSTTLMRLDTLEGTARPLSAGAPPGVLSWVVDGRGEPRAAVASVDQATRLYWRDADGGWRLLHEAPRYLMEISPVAVDAAGTLYVTAARGDAGGTLALYRYDVAQRRLQGEPLLALAGFDFQGPLVFDARRERVLGARYLTDAAGTAWFDPAWRRVQERVDKLLPATVNELSCGRCDDVQHVLVRAASDRQSPVYWLYDPKADQLQRVAATRPWMDPKAMAERSFVRFAARDGLQVPMYVTQPAGKGPWPAVVLVHGGPWVRGGQWEWSAQAQFLASRGYLVLEPEFRGSTGFGARHLHAGFRQWGLAMQDDLADAALWAVQQGLADRSRLCIAGASYGGYAALMGLVRHPDLYRCAVNWVGVTDIELMYTISWSDFSDAWKRYGMPTLVGDRMKDAAQLAATSPLKQAAAVRQPLLLAYGGSDRRVPIAHGTRFRDAVQRHNADVEWVAYPAEGHGFLLLENRVDFWRRVEKFLARHLKAPATAAGAAAPES